MAGSARLPQSAPAATPPLLKKSTSGSQSSKDQKSILGFFQKKASEVPKTASTAQSKANGTALPLNRSRRTTLPKPPLRGSSSSLTPAPSSDALEEPDEFSIGVDDLVAADDFTGLPSPITPAISAINVGTLKEEDVSSSFNSPSRKVCALAFSSRIRLLILSSGEEGGELCRVGCRR